MNPVDVRQQLIDSLRLDLIGPGEVIGHAAHALVHGDEILPQQPSSWYLTGFLVPLDADPEQKTDAQSAEEVDEFDERGGSDDAVTPEPAAARVRFLPSSMGASLLVAADVRKLRVVVRWGDYKARDAKDDEPGQYVWERTPREETVVVSLPDKTDQPVDQPVLGSDGLFVVASVRPVVTDNLDGALPAGTKSVSLFLVNRRRSQHLDRSGHHRRTVQDSPHLLDSPSRRRASGTNQRRGR